MTSTHRVPTVTVATTKVDAGSYFHAVHVNRADAATIALPIYGDRAAADRLAAELRGALADAYHAGTTDRPAGPTLWELDFARYDDDGNDHGFERHAWGPAPIEDAATWRTIPADVREWAQMIGRSNGALRVRYCLPVLADVTDYATSQMCAELPATTELYAETIDY